MKVAFLGIDIINDVITEDNGNQINSIPVYQYAATTAGWGIDEDVNGTKCPTFDKPTATMYTITINGNVVIPTCELVGGRPPVKDR